MADLKTNPGAEMANNPMDLLLDIPIQVTVELGRQRMTIQEILNLGAGSIVELTKAAGEPLDIYVNDRLVAKGEAVMVGERYGVRITEIQQAHERSSSISFTGALT